MTDRVPAPSRRRRWPWITLATVALLVSLLAVGAWWSLRTDSGQRWTMDHLPGLQIENRQGRPDGGPFSADRVQWEGAGLRIVLHDLAWDDADWTWRPHPGTWMSLALQRPRVRLIEVFPKPTQKADETTSPPQDLALPVALSLRQLHVGEVRWSDDPVLNDLDGDIHLGAQQGATHRAQLQARYQQYRLQARGSIQAAAPMQTEGALQLATQADASRPWQAQARWHGHLEKPALEAQLAMGDRQILNAQAMLSPFATLPLVSLSASTDRLDLAVLHPSLPVTSLTGTATVDTHETRGPLSVRLALDNAQAGSLTAGALPVQQLRLSAEDRAGALVITELMARLHGDREAGQILGKGQWKGSSLSLALELSGLHPQAIHQQAPSMTLNGTAKLSLQGLPALPRAGATVSPRPAKAGPDDPLSGEADIALAGELRSPQGAVKSPVRLQTQVALRMQGPPADRSLSLSLAPLSLEAGKASAQAQASFTRDADQGWHVVSQGRLVSFDPSIWWAGPAGTDWRRMRHDLQGEWNVDVKALPPPAAGQPAPSLLASLRGQGSLRLKNSVLAGVPVSGEGTLEAGDDLARVSASLRAASNQLEGSVRWPHASVPEWTARIDAPALRSLAPWKRLAPELAQWLPVTGTVHAKTSGQGTWPALKTSGQLSAQGVVSERWGIAQARADWQAELARPEAPLSMSLQAKDARWTNLAIGRASLTARGSLSAHRLELDASATSLPADEGEKAAQAAAPSPRTDLVSLQLHGGWAPREGCAGTWQGTIDHLTASPASRKTAPWVEASGVQATVHTTQPCGLASARLAPNEARVLGATLRWRSAEMTAGKAGAPMDLKLDARLLPVQVAPLMDRLGQAERWRGDLQVAGRIFLHSGADATQADIELKRTGGDLVIQQPGQGKGFPLGLRGMRLAATTRNGVWHLEQEVSGQAIGTLKGEQTIRMDRSGLVPGPQAALSGNLDMQLRQLGVWSAWIPPPWRVEGQLSAQLALAGTLGSPSYRGRLTGSGLAVRNVLEGIELRDGELALALQGQRATLEKLAFRGGQGTLTARGTATLGDTPQARLQVVADDLLASGRVDRRIVLSGQSSIELSASRIGVNGNFTVDEGLIDITQASAPKLDEDVVIRPRPGQRPPRPPSGQAQADPGQELALVDMNVGIDLGQHLRLTGRGIETRLTGALRVTTPEGELTVHGTVRTEGGRYAAYGQNLSIERGIIRFDGDLDTPTLDILALRPDIDMRVGVAITGYAADPRVRLYSEPEMSDIDKLSWLVMGRASEGLGRNDTALLQKAALALLAGDKKPSSPGFVQRLGLDELALARGESGDLRDTVVTLGKQLSERWHIAYAQGLNATTGSWQLIYRVARQFTVRLSAGADSAVDVVKTWRFDGRKPNGANGK